MARPELGTKRLCPNCGTKYYDLNHDPITCPKCNALFLTGVISARPIAAADEDDEDVEGDDEGVEMVALEDAAEEEAEGDDAIPADGDEDVIDVDADDDALIDEVDDEDEVSDVVRGGDDEEEEER